MALKIPFTRLAFSTEMKPLFSGGNVTLQYDNLESPLTKVGVEVAELIGSTLYNGICDSTAAKTIAVAAHDDIPEVLANSETEINASAKDYLQRAMINFAMYQHTIFMIAKIGNDGITQKKSDSETPIYKYQKENLDNKLINDAWFWMNQLIRFLNDNAVKFADWNDSEPQKQINSIPVLSADFKKWVGVADEYFMLNASGLIREVWTECVLSRNPKATKTDDIARAVCYDVMARACTVLSYYCLPEPIRRDMNNELTKDHASQEDTHVRETVAIRFQTKADGYWRALDIKLANDKITETESRASTQSYKPRAGTDCDAFVY